ncbi:MAG TPA: hypothetical protein VMB51_07030 [Solirubrobacteraceae bacterium]|nr:hypothetical protein [Solirubrobacteraceae bacterium]
MPADLLTTIRDEIDVRLRELRPLLEEYEELLSVDDALAREQAGAGSRGAPITRAPGARERKPTRARARVSRPGPARKATSRAPRAPRGAAGRAILAALEHGSHSVRELVVVTAMNDANIRANVRRLLDDGAVVKVTREGKAAYALPATAPV